MIVTIAEVKDVLRPDTTDYDTSLERLIKRKQAIAEKYTGRKFEIAEYDEEYDGEESDTIFLNQYPVGKITSLKSNSVLISSDNYKIQKEEGILRLKGGAVFSEGIQNVEVVYKAGWSEDNMPEDLKDAVIQLVCAEFCFTQLMVHTVEGDSVADKKSELETDAYKILDLYKRPKI